MADWDEVKRLAADFQKAQLTSTLQKYVDRLDIYVPPTSAFLLIPGSRNIIVWKLLHCCWRKSCSRLYLPTMAKNI